jgi:hypothetical protein
MTQFAQWIARGGGSQRLALAVDAANRHALAIYAASGFKAFERKSVLGKALSTKVGAATSQELRE